MTASSLGTPRRRRGPPAACRPGPWRHQEAGPARRRHDLAEGHREAVGGAQGCPRPQVRRDLGGEHGGHRLVRQHQHDRVGGGHGRGDRRHGAAFGAGPFGPGGAGAGADQDLHPAAAQVQGLGAPHGAVADDRHGAPAQRAEVGPHGLDHRTGRRRNAVKNRVFHGREHRPRRPP